MKQIPLSKGKFATVDDEDYDRLMLMGKWHYISSGYAARTIMENGSRKVVLMHRFIMNTPTNMLTDHKDEDGLNNQKCNLRICSKSENGRNRGKQGNNTSGFKGVCWNKYNKRWVAKLRLNNKTINLGYFDDRLLAAKAYNEAAKIHFGEFAKLNTI